MNVPTRRQPGRTGRTRATPRTDTDRDAISSENGDDDQGQSVMNSASEYGDKGESSSSSKYRDDSESSNDGDKNEPSDDDDRIKVGAKCSRHASRRVRSSNKKARTVSIAASHVVPCESTYILILSTFCRRPRVYQQPHRAPVQDRPVTLRLRLRLRLATATAAATTRRRMMSHWPGQPRQGPRLGTLRTTRRRTLSQTRTTASTTPWRLSQGQRPPCGTLS